jgi:anti-anti-sigma factor
MVRLAGVRYMNSFGLAVLISALRECRRTGIGYLILDPSPAVRAVVHLSKLTHFFPVVERDADQTDFPAPAAKAC